MILKQSLAPLAQTGCIPFELGAVAGGVFEEIPGPPPQAQTGCIPFELDAVVGDVFKEISGPPPQPKLDASRLN